MANGKTPKIKTGKAKQGRFELPKVTYRRVTVADYIRPVDDELRNHVKLNRANETIREKNMARSKRERRRLSRAIVSGDCWSDDEDETDITENWQPVDIVTTVEWATNFKVVMTKLQDRKRTDNFDRVYLLTHYNCLMSTCYAGDAIQPSLADAATLLVRSVRCGLYMEKQAALNGLAVTVLSCPTPADAAVVHDASIGALKAIAMNRSLDSSSRALAIRTLTLVVVCGANMKSALDGLLKFLLDIVESDGASVYSRDNEQVVIAAIKAWSFAVTFVIAAVEDLAEDQPEADAVLAAQKKEEERQQWLRQLEHPELWLQQQQQQQQKQQQQKQKQQTSSKTAEDDADYLMGENYLIAQSQIALDVFTDQLGSPEIDVQLEAARAIALLYEASREYEEVLDKPLELREDPCQLAEEILELMPGSGNSVFSINRQGRRELRASFRSVATSLARGVGPDYNTATVFPKDGKTYIDNPEELGHQQRVIVGNRVMTIDTWCKSIRMDMLRTVLGGYINTHLLRNPLVRQIADADSLEQTKFSLCREREKLLKIARIKAEKEGHIKGVKVRHLGQGPPKEERKKALKGRRQKAMKEGETEAPQEGR